MDELRTIRICEPATFLYYEKDQLAITDGDEGNRSSACEVAAAAGPLCGIFRDLAAGAIQRGEDVDGKVWVTEAHVLAALPFAQAGFTASVGTRPHCG